MKRIQKYNYFYSDISASLKIEKQHLMEGIPSLFFLGKGVEKFKNITTAYLVFISALLANGILNQAFNFYRDKKIQLSLASIVDFIFSSQGALFVTAWGMTVLSHYYLMPIVIKAMLFIVRSALIVSGNLSLFLFYLVLTKIIGLKAEKKFSLLLEHELLNYLLYPLHVLRYKNARVFRGKRFEFFSWYVTNIAAPGARAVANTCLTAAIFMSSWTVACYFNFFKHAPVIFFAIACLSISQTVIAIVASWVEHRSGYFLSLVDEYTNHYTLER